MILDFDESKLLYGLGAFLGVISIVYFGHEIILDLSPTIKAFMLLSSTALFLLAADYLSNSVLRSSFYVFSGFSYLSFLVYIFARFSFTTEQTFLILASSSSLFIGLGYLKSEKGYELSGIQVTKAAGAVLALVALLIVFDVMGAQPQYELQLEDSVQVVEGEEARFGQLVVRNDFLFSRNLDVPSFGGCAVTPSGEERGIYVSPEDPGLIEGDTTLRFNLTDSLRTRPDSNGTVSGNYTVNRGECPEEPARGNVYIEESDGREILRSVD